MLMTDDRRGMLAEPLKARRAALEEFLSQLGAARRLRLSPFSRRPADAKAWLAKAGRGALDGVIAKPLDEPYRPGERAMLKVKCLRTADCVVGGFRYATGSTLVGSMLLGLFDNDGKLDHVGFTSGISNEERPALKPVVVGAQRRMGAIEAEACRGGAIRSRDRRPVSSRHEVPPLAAGQGAEAMHLRPACARSTTFRAHPPRSGIKARRVASRFIPAPARPDGSPRNCGTSPNSEAREAEECCDTIPAVRARAGDRGSAAQR
jgi:hypothetical protein